MSNRLLRSLPSIERLLERPLGSRLSAELGRDRVRDLLREITAELRDQLTRAPHSSANFQESLTEEVERMLARRAAECAQPSLRRVINATGVLIHTNLGRSPLARQAIEAVAEVGANYSNLEYDLSRGERGKRETHCQELLSRLAGSEAAVLVNNNAAAVMLVLNTLAEGGEVIVSRGELIEIGGSFRIPDVMTKSGATLREVGTTNRTRIADYQRAINDRTKLILRVHPSNYRIIGFTERPSVQEIAQLSLETGIPSFEDLGSGCLIDLSPYGVKDEPVVAESLKSGISVVSFSGDKMLGGPQAGVIAGSRKIIDQVRANPLMRALRVDKMTYAAFEATLRLYESNTADLEVPVIRAIALTREEIGRRANLFCESVNQSTNGEFTAKIEEGASVIGGGSAPEVKLPTMLVVLEHSALSSSSIVEGLRSYRIPIIARMERDRVLLDFRTVGQEEEDIILDAIKGIAQPAPQTAASV
ncbi:MAG TPA: L-seryl-tRNA(Sec) selenium transferase [Blastocatellia bacterium]|nr:L-seryl-tRNA(Sec) selenium transferase [Blastocatellia bacterium]